MFNFKKDNLDFTCYPANFHGHNNKSAYICTQNKIIENFESNTTLPYLQNVKFVRIASSGEGTETATNTSNNLELSQIVIKDDNDVNIAKNGGNKVTTSKPHPDVKWTGQNLISGEEKSTEWPDCFGSIADGNKFFVEVELANPSNVSEVTVYTRASTPYYLDGGGGNAVVWFFDSNRKVLAKRSFPGTNVSKRVIKNLGPPNATPGPVKFVRIERTDPNSTQGYIQFYQIMVLDVNNLNVAYGQLVTSPHLHRAPELGVDNFDNEEKETFNRDGGKLVHSHGGRKGDFYEIQLASPTAIKQLKLYNRGDCCQDAISHFKIVLLDSDRKELFSNNFNRENLQIIDVNGPASVATGPAPTTKRNVKSFPAINCDDSSTQVGLSCYPNSLINKK
jgi:hypothetical protein